MKHLEPNFPLAGEAAPVAPETASVETAQRLIQTGDISKAVTVLEQVHAADRSAVEPLLLLAELAQTLSNPSRERDALEALIAVAPYFDPAYTRLASVEEQAGRLPEAEAVYERLNERIGGMTDTLFAIGTCALRRGDFGKAQHWIDRGLNALLPAKTMRSLQYGTVSLSRLDHDLAHLEWLEAKTDLELPYRGLRVAYEAARSSAPELDLLDGGEPTWEVDQSTLMGMMPFYRRCRYIYPADRRSHAAINSELLEDAAVASVKSEFAEKGWVVLDDFLTQEALAELQCYALRSTIWHNDSQKGLNYVGAYMQSGFRCPLIDQISEEISALWQDIIRGEPLDQVWAYRVVSGTDAIGLHADFAKTNLNIWITPDEANEDQETGGLIIYDRPVPETMSFKDYNSGSPEFATLLRASESSRIPYRCNRAMLFNSRLPHASDRVHFRPSFESMRTNITFLYGNRER